jgi:hypothetical protein
MKKKISKWNCKTDCQWLTPDGCYLDLNIPNPDGDLTFEVNDSTLPTCWMYMKPLELKPEVSK